MVSTHLLWPNDLTPESKNENGELTNKQTKQENYTDLSGLTLSSTGTRQGATGYLLFIKGPRSPYTRLESNDSGRQIRGSTFIHGSP